MAMFRSTAARCQGIIVLLAAVLLLPLAPNAASSEPVAPQIVGGREVPERFWQRNYRWMVALAAREDAGEDWAYICTATLVARNWVMTAAHCLQPEGRPEPRRADQLLAGLDTRVLSGGTGIRIREVIIHPDWMPGRYRFHLHDIALLRLESPAPEDLPLVRLADRDMDALLTVPGTRARGAGWGRVAEDGPVSDALKDLRAQIRRLMYCRTTTGLTRFTDGHICSTTSPGSGLCLGDSGGPLVVEDEDGWVQVGLLSWGRSCTQAVLPTIHTRVGEYRDWIEAYINPARPRMVQVAAGDNHTCALDETGQVWCWGSNNSGQIGDGTNDNRNRPVRVEGLQDVVEIALGSYHSCARHENGHVSCWGNNWDGQLGDGTIENRQVPVEVIGLNDVSQIAAGYVHTCALRENGRVFCWGENGFGQLGDGSYNDHVTPNPVASLGRVVQIDLGYFHSCARRENGRVFCWGDNWFGQLGDGTNENRQTPVPVAAGRANQIAVGADHSCLRRENGRLICWGGNHDGQLGDGTTENRNTPVPAQLGNVADIGLGGQHSCARQVDGRVVCWGWNALGQLGLGTRTTRELVPMEVMHLLRDRPQLALGGSHTCALLQIGSVFCWGSNWHGGLGDGTTTLRETPVRVQFPD